MTILNKEREEKFKKNYFGSTVNHPSAANMASALKLPSTEMFLEVWKEVVAQRGQFKCGG
jgi:hypothetical protein